MMMLVYVPNVASNDLSTKQMYCPDHRKLVHYSEKESKRVNE